MSFVYNYANADPPAPFVLVNLSAPDGAASVTNLPAKIDTGADQTVIPTAIAVRLGLAEIERRRFAGLAGQVHELPVYEVQLIVRDLAPIGVKVAASDGEPHILLGRDVLNRYRIVLDGPNLKLEIS